MAEEGLDPMDVWMQSGIGLGLGPAGVVPAPTAPYREERHEERDAQRPSPLKSYFGEHANGVQSTDAEAVMMKAPRVPEAEHEPEPEPEPARTSIRVRGPGHATR